MLELSTYRSFMEGLREAEPALVDGLIQYWDALVEAAMYEATYKHSDGREVSTKSNKAYNANRLGDQKALDRALDAAERGRNVMNRNLDDWAEERGESRSKNTTRSNSGGSRTKKSKDNGNDDSDTDSSKKSLRAQRAAKNNGQQYYSQNGYGLEYDKRWSSAVRNVADKRGKHKLKEHGLVELLGIPQNSTIFDKYKGRPRDLAEDVLDNSDSTRQAHGRLSFTGNVRSDAVGQLFKKAAKFVSEISAEYKSDHDPKVAKKKKPKAKRVYGKQAQPKRKSTAKVVKA